MVWYRNKPNLSGKYIKNILKRLGNHDNSHFVRVEALSFRVHTKTVERCTDRIRTDLAWEQITEQWIGNASGPSSRGRDT
jgi:hypothetical protein